MSDKNFFILFILVIIVLAWYSFLHSKKPTNNPPPTALHLDQRTKFSNCQMSGGLPDHTCTPGAVFADVTADQICKSGYSKSVRDVSAETKRQAYQEYNISYPQPTGSYEVDHLISLELGGSNTIANLWPEAAEPRPGFHEKDEVENYLHDQICSGRMSLQEAQNVISSDWLVVYQHGVQ